ncbi:hypothetical protein [Cohnella sp.]
MRTILPGRVVVISHHHSALQQKEPEAISARMEHHTGHFSLPPRDRESP